MLNVCVDEVPEKKQGNLLNICENPYCSKSGSASIIYRINIQNWMKTKQPLGFTF